MYKKNIFHYCCYVLIFSFVILLLTPFITCLMYIKSGEDVIGFGVMTGIIAVAGMFVSFMGAYTLYRQEHPLKNNDSDEDQEF
ncbi:hypothetical protein [Vallitalea guaymasensis]|uniref:Uncharacterized protein n=1 Tax=Vallitalea guaymasensis TaxID=1185412 RepID=A0A8J8M8G0_9FIRM|nr:hypothetical protein [Vallitalea guaymasensis]QUH28279.1 hypothetical protein HYG85_04850 [Vallitalea guaymasensis]